MFRWRSVSQRESSDPAGFSRHVSHLRVIWGKKSESGPPVAREGSRIYSSLFGPRSMCCLLGRDSRAVWSGKGTGSRSGYCVRRPGGTLSYGLPFPPLPPDPPSEAWRKLSLQTLNFRFRNGVGPGRKTTPEHSKTRTKRFSAYSRVVTWTAGRQGAAYSAVVDTILSQHCVTNTRSLSPDKFNRSVELSIGDDL